MFQTFDDTTEPARVGERVRQLRAWMSKAGLQAFLVPRGDEHGGEYVAPGAERLKWLTAFSGSAGVAVVGTTKAALFIDGRYTVQAKAQTNTKVFNIESIPARRPEDWLSETLDDGDVVGFDPWLHSIDEIERTRKALKSRGVRLKPVARNPIDALWGADRPAAPDSPIRVHPMSQAGESAPEKVARIQAVLDEAGDDAAVLTQPDSICWLLNIRGSDVAHNPIVLAFAVVPRAGSVELYVDATKVQGEAAEHLAPVATIHRPSELRSRLIARKQAGETIRVDRGTAAFWFLRQLGARAARFAGDPCVLPKAIKNRAEIRGTRNAHLRDGVAVCRFLAWLDREAARGGVDEIGAARHLESCRADTGKLAEISFDTISGSGPNGAIVHYRVNEQTNRRLGRGELYLVDSGAQYPDGTTDITRTVAIGPPTDAMRQTFTLVLKGHIAIAAAYFPEGTRGVDIDPLARHALWREGFDYDHGTGHGVGSYLSVHEGPQSISKRGMVALQPGMIVSNEPGYYREGAFGIRIENLVLVRPAQKPKGGDRRMLSFETLTLAPIDRRLIDPALLTEFERVWIDDYHARVRKMIGAKLSGNERDWLMKATAPLEAD